MRIFNREKTREKSYISILISTRFKSYEEQQKFANIAVFIVKFLYKILILIDKGLANIY